jgi:uncharacterized protein (UPF0548 family)
MRITPRRGFGRTLVRYQDATLTYEPIGATNADLPADYGHTQRRELLGSGRHTFERASAALLTWQMHSRCGLAVAADGPAEVGRTVVLGLGSPVTLVIPCRVVYVIDEPRRRGFAYGTLTGHPEQGEEAFVISVDEDDSVWFEITAFSRAGSTLVRWSGPIAKAVQARATTRYVHALAFLIDA